MTRAAPFTQASAERAIKAARKLGLHVTGMQIQTDGSITILTSEQDSIPKPFGLTGGPKLRDAREKFRAG